MATHSLYSWFRFRCLKLELLCRPHSRSSILFKDGYQSIKNSHDLNRLRSFINSVANDLGSQIQITSDQDTEHTVIRKGVHNFLIQKLFTNIFSGDLLTRSFIISTTSGTKLWFPLSKKMRYQAQCHGISISSFACTVLWFLYKLRTTAAIALLELLKTHSMLEVGKNRDCCLYVFDAGLQKSDRKRIQILSSFAIWFDAMPKKLKEESWPATKVIEPPTINTSNHFLVRTFKIDFSLRLYFVLSVLIDSLIPFNLFRNFLMNISKVLLPPLVSEIINRHRDVKNFYLIPSNSGFVRPIWTYLYQFLGSEFLFVQLSNAVDPNPFEAELLNIEPLNSWSAIYSPKNILSPNFKEFQKPFPNDWTRIPDWNMGVALPDSIKKSQVDYISIFDIEPLKDWYGISTLNEMGYDHVEVVSRFLRTTLEVACNENFTLLHKPKRNIGTSRLTEYTRLLIELHEDYPSNYILVPADISPRQVIEISKGVISMPCTSTAFIAQDFGSPTIFFDCTKLINPLDKAAAGIEILQDKKQLSVWMQSLS